MLGQPVSFSGGSLSHRASSIGNDNKYVGFDEVEFKHFSADDFVALWQNYELPNTKTIVEAPEITSSSYADQRIHDVIRNAGFMPEVIITGSLATVERTRTDYDKPLQLQPLARTGWREMQEAARQDNVSLTLRYGYRSTENQQGLFARAMTDAGISVFGVADGYSDAAVSELAESLAPPGYSIHHSGYAAEIGCEGIGQTSFTTSSCFGWLSKDNFYNAKRFGWVPATPKGTNQDLLEVSPARFVWVGTSVLKDDE